MRLRAAILVGFCVGYYLGAKAGRERYEQLRRMVDKTRGSGVYGSATQKARELADHGVGRVKGYVEERRSGDGDATVTEAVPPLP
ncbi:MAG: YtxH domain-containing protein [Acidimicrobiales bacterium]